MYPVIGLAKDVVLSKGHTILQEHIENKNVYSVYVWPQFMYMATIYAFDYYSVCIY